MKRKEKLFLIVKKFDPFPILQFLNFILLFGPFFPSKKNKKIKGKKKMEKDKENHDSPLKHFVMEYYKQAKDWMTVTKGLLIGLTVILLIMLVIIISQSKSISNTSHNLQALNSNLSDVSKQLDNTKNELKNKDQVADDLKQQEDARKMMNDAINSKIKKEIKLLENEKVVLDKNYERILDIKKKITEIVRDFNIIHGKYFNDKSLLDDEIKLIKQFNEQKEELSNLYTKHIGMIYKYNEKIKETQKKYPYQLFSVTLFLNTTKEENTIENDKKIIGEYQLLIKKDFENDKSRTTFENGQVAEDPFAAEWKKEDINVNDAPAQQQSKPKENEVFDNSFVEKSSTPNPEPKKQEEKKKPLGKSNGAAVQKPAIAKDEDDEGFEYFLQENAKLEKQEEKKKNSRVDKIFSKQEQEKEKKKKEEEDSNEDDDLDENTDDLFQLTDNKKQAKRKEIKQKEEKEEIEEEKIFKKRVKSKVDSSKYSFTRLLSKFKWSWIDLDAPNGDSNLVIPLLGVYNEVENSKLMKFFSIRRNDFTFKLPENIHSSIKLAFERLKERASKMSNSKNNFENTPMIEREILDSSKITFKITKNKEINSPDLFLDESYKIEIDPKSASILIDSKNSVGVIRALSTIYQLLISCDNTKLQLENGCEVNKKIFFFFIFFILFYFLLLFFFF